ncbi:MAG TPA: radical SAM protein [Syntrophales bacterium]|nr:radical SAM protein [Syntrophales bacterium]HQN26601.1 radical SAM protein [Syntrophales bacterium]HQP29071.1 radical SAM protein [Syntrophales bacterium]
MRIVLIHPAGSNWVPGKKDITATANRMAPLGLLSIAAYLSREGHEVFVHDCLGPRAVPGPAANARLVLEGDPDLVGFSATTSGFLDAWEMAAAIKAARPEVVTVFGGVHVSALEGALLERFDAIDYLCPGEGEATLAELASGADPAGIAGLIRRDGERVVANPPRAPLADLDDLPFPAYEKLAGFPRGYNLPLFSYVQFPGATMITSRGCPYQCSYCDRSVFKRGYRYNSAAYIYDHLNHLRTRFGVRHVNIYDDLFTANRPRITALCEKLMQNPLGMQFNCAVRVGQTDRELLAMLKAAGALMVSLGIESADPEMLARHKAGVTLEEVRETVAMIRAAGLRAKGLFMMGLPGETEASIRRTSDFVLALGLDDMNMTKFTPFPGAPLWATIRDEGRFDEDWRRMNCLNFVFVPKGIASRERLDQLYNAHVKRFYTDPVWRRRFRSRLWEHRHSLWHMAKHLPDFIAARRHFEPARNGRRADPIQEESTDR